MCTEVMNKIYAKSAEKLRFLHLSVLCTIIGEMSA